MSTIETEVMIIFKNGVQAQFKTTRQPSEVMKDFEESRSVSAFFSHPHSEARAGRFVARHDEIVLLAARAASDVQQVHIVNPKNLMRPQ